MTADLVLFHTVDSNAALYEHAGKPLDNLPPVTHVISNSLIQRATDAGELTPAIHQDAIQEIQDALTPGSVLLCTCSTIGPAADDLAAAGQAVLRTDRALAEEVFASPGRVAVLVAAPSTVEPTTDLFADAARNANGVSFDVILVDSAWDQFIAGNTEAYARLIANATDECSNRFDRIALAQASMAPAKLLAKTEIPVFTSPEAGMRAANMAATSG